MSVEGNINFPNLNNQFQQLRETILDFDVNQLRAFFHVLDRVGRLPQGLREEFIDSTRKPDLRLYVLGLSLETLLHPDVRENIILIRDRRNVRRPIQTTAPSASSAPSTATRTLTKQSASQPASKPPESVQQPKLAGVARGQPATGGRLIKKIKTAASGQQQQATSTGTPETCRTPERKSTRIDVATPSPPGQQQRPATPTGQAPGTGQSQMQQPDALQQAMAAAFGNQSPGKPQQTGQFVNEPQQYQSMPRIGFPDPMAQGVQQPQQQQQMPTGRAPVTGFQQAMPRVLCEEDEETRDQGSQDPENQ